VLCECTGQRRLLRVKNYCYLCKINSLSRIESPEEDVEGTIDNFLVVFTDAHLLRLDRIATDDVDNDLSLTTHPLTTPLDMGIAMAEDSTDIDDLSLDDLSGIFHEDGPTNTETTVTSSHALEMESATSANAPFELFEPLETPSAVGSSASVLSLSQVGSACASLAPISLESRRRRSSQNRGADGKAPAEGWHSETEDRTHRQRMIHEV
jgi:hypothetical protein